MIPDGAGNARRIALELPEVDVIVARLDEGPFPLDAATALLSDSERSRADRFAFDRDRHRYIWGRAMLRTLLGNRLGLSAAGVPLIEGAQGKPELDGRAVRTRLKFNLSHSNDVVAYAFALGQDIGIDIEFRRPMDDADAIAARYFSPAENSAYLGLDIADRSLGFFNCWTRKEAFVKALGQGLGYPLDSFDVSLAPGEKAEILRVGNKPGRDSGWRLEAFSPASGFVAAIVVGDTRQT